MSDGTWVVWSQVMHRISLWKLPCFLVLEQWVQEILHQNGVGVQEDRHCWEQDVDSLDVSIRAYFFEK